MTFNPYADQHLCVITKAMVDRIKGECSNCGAPAGIDAQYCFGCGHFVVDERNDLQRTWDDYWTWFQEHNKDWLKSEEMLAAEAFRASFVFPNTGVYVLYHKEEGYKIGLAEDVRERVRTLRCAAPSLELLHVVETSDLDWCEHFLHSRYAHRRRRKNREYFNLAKDDLEWLFSIYVLEPPRSIAQQLSLLDLL